MKVLVIPDVHLKAHMFERADELLRNGRAERAMCLMDIADDWNCEYDLDKYRLAYDAAIAFAKSHKDTLWCWGNHDVCYPWNQRESGYSKMAPKLVCDKLRELRAAIPEKDSLAFIQKIGNVVFMHGGLGENYVREYCADVPYEDVDAVIAKINTFRCTQLWRYDSPIWLRPQYGMEKMYTPNGLIQVVGHTPIDDVKEEAGVISCDVFSTYRNGKPIGTCRFPVIDTETGAFETVK